MYQEYPVGRQWTEIHEVDASTAVEAAAIAASYRGHVVLEGTGVERLAEVRPARWNPWSRDDYSLQEQGRLIRDEPELAARMREEAFGERQ